MHPVFRKVAFALLLTSLFAAHQTAMAADTFPVFVRVSGLPTSTSGVVLQNNGGSDRTVSVNTTISFGSFAPGTAYNVTVKAHPSHHAADCTVTRGAGTVANA